MSPGTQFEVDLHDRVQRQMWAGCYEPHVRKCLESLLADGDIFMDVGAHIGYFTAIAAQHVGPSGKVFAFEPDPVLHESLARNVAQLPWVQTFHCAVWKESGALVFERSCCEAESGWGTLTSVRDLGRGEHVPVKALCLDDWAEGRPIDRVHAIKIDTEGSEVNVLTGARRTIEKYRPMLIVEVNEVVLRQAGASGMKLATHPALENYGLFGLEWPRLHRLGHGQAPDAGEMLCIPHESTQARLDVLRKAGFKLC
jgi:FkbM family methyltransferase